MPKLSELTAIEELDGTESIPAIIEGEGGAFLNVRVPLSVAMAAIGATSFAALLGVPGDNAALAAVLEAITSPETLEEEGTEAGELALLDEVPIELVTGLEDALDAKANAAAVAAALEDKADTAVVAAALAGKLNATNPAITGTPTTDIYAITDGGSVTIDPADGEVQTWTLGGSRTPTLTSITAGKAVLLLIDDGSGGTLTLSSVTWLNNDGSAPTFKTSGYTPILLFNVGGTLFGWLCGDGG